MNDPVSRIRAYHAELTAFRRDLHAHPELAYQEDRTSRRVSEHLAAWGIPELVPEFRFRSHALVLGALAVLAGFGVQTRAQVQYWRNSNALWQRAHTVDSGLTPLPCGKVGNNIAFLDVYRYHPVPRRD